MKELIQLLDTLEHKEMARTVISQLKSKIRKKNYFGWTTFIDDVIIDTISYMISTGYRYSIGGYIQVGMTTAIDKCKYCNAKCRKESYLTVSLDDEDSYIQIEDANSDPAIQMEREQDATDLYERIAEQFGEELANQLKPVIYGMESKLERKVLKQCKTPEFKEFLRGL